MAQAEQRLAQALPALGAEPSLAQVLCRLDRPQTPERPWPPFHDRGELLRGHATPHADPGHREGIVTPAPPGDPARAEHPVTEPAEDRAQPGRRPAARERSREHGDPQPILEQRLGIPVLGGDGRPIESIEEGMGHGVTADLHPTRDHLAELCPGHVSRLADGADHHEEGGAEAELTEGGKDLGVVAARAVVERERVHTPADLRREAPHRHAPAPRVGPCPQQGAKLLGRQHVWPMTERHAVEVRERHHVVEAEDRRPLPHTYPSPSSMSWIRACSSSEKRWSSASIVYGCSVVATGRAATLSGVSADSRTAPSISASTGRPSRCSTVVPTSSMLASGALAPRRTSGPC